MKKIVILLLVGNISFVLADPPADSSKCQRFVSLIFERYNLPDPQTLEVSFGNFDQEKPEFVLLLEHTEITPQGEAGEDSTDQRNIVFAIGETLESGHYILRLNERANLPGNQTASNITHLFSFSSDCEFEEYKVEKKPLEEGVNIITHKFSYDSNCVYNNNNNNYPSSITRYSYYQGLCSLAREKRGKAEQDAESAVSHFNFSYPPEPYHKY